MSAAITYVISSVETLADGSVRYAVRFGDLSLRTYVLRPPYTDTDHLRGAVELSFAQGGSRRQRPLGGSQ